MPIPFLGELAALATSIFFSIGPTFFTLSGRLVGAALVNRTRLLAATLILMLVHSVLYTGLLPVQAEPFRWGWLALSGLIGLALGDAFLFQAFVQIGARLTMLVFSLAPVLTAVLGFIWLGETLSAVQLAGMAVTLSGVLWVISEPRNRKPREEFSKAEFQKKGPSSFDRNYVFGLFFAFMGAMGQGAGLITAKLGLAGDFPVLSGQIIRMLAATLVVWLFALARRQGRQTLERLREQPLALRYILLGALFGPVIGVWFSLTAVKFTEVGVASTLMALPPIFLIAIDHFIFKEPVSLRAVTGTIVALIGVAILFLV